MAKTLIDIDETWLGKAAELLGTKTKKDTVNRVLEEWVKSQLRMQFVEWMSSDDAPDVLDPTIRKSACGD
jgi:Arc/MetJ family transcription regulator